MSEFLLELHSEEIPARMQAKAADDLKKLITDRLKEAGLVFTDARAFVTPRRLALVVDGLPARQPDVSEEKKGPKVGAPEKALVGFMRANNLSSIDQAEVRETPKGDFYFLMNQIKGRATAEVLSDVVVETLKAFPWPKSMKWSRNSFRWVRPLHSILAIFNGETLSGSFDFGAQELTFGNKTRGHRFLAPDWFEVENLDDYLHKLRLAKVLVDADERRKLIAEQAGKLCVAEGLVLKDDQGLLNEVAGLVEWPVVLMGKILDRFMSVPHEVLSTSMKEHQKYFSVLDKDGKLANRFVFAANTEAVDGGETIIAGNERVLASRLSDAEFFWEQDKKHRLDSRVDALKSIVFQAKLGTVADKIGRVRVLAGSLANQIGCDTTLAQRAAELAKADLNTGMVGEFPELQGVMGRYYALHDGENSDVAEAIADHYSPLGPSDRCPSAPTSVAVALADKLDTLVGFFGINELPTGSKDPFALRRAALGVIRLITENNLRVSLTQALKDSYAAYSGQLTEAEALTVDGLMAFFADRLKVALKDQGVRHDLVTAVFELGNEDDLVRLLARVSALAELLDTDDGVNLLAAYRRAMNIVRIEEKKDKTAYDGSVDAALLQQPEEKALHEALEKASGEAKTALASEGFKVAMSALAGLRPPMDAFFDKVTVNDDDPALRKNRLGLLSRVGVILGQVADFSRIEG
ncbi:glycine--tRNA ligase subunit beta [Kiloniella laminariae]|uniref:Glycine--tRNA ligase beta subunit n=1 Tax=Kiloniella laminariae TaxID=454162 RepID=A0ABT4LEK1_9PROT|nr:glycine--tRNA ligase subunit beta [Kiloniella laminariae]MCZ4279529.1 glycine--tRNA ligase subunit beta [Kiloniella laminariae]